jgi:uncharacterized membrane protein (DUF106 family)
MFLFFEEPVYGREHIDPLANLSEQTILEKINDPTMEHYQNEKADANVDASQLERANTAAIEQRKTFVQRLKVYNGRFSHDNFFTLLYRVLILTFHPTIFWVATSGLVLSWPVGISYTAAAFLTLPPYNFGFTGVANMYIGAWIGMVLGLLIGAPTFQWLAKYLARKNKNVYEPEFLLYQVIPGMAFCIVGFVGWGIGEANTISWAGLAVFFAFANGGAVMYNNAAINYIIDAHRNWANEASVVCFAAKVSCTSKFELMIRTSSHLAWATSLSHGGLPLDPRPFGASLPVFKPDLLYLEFLSISMERGCARSGANVAS